MVSGLTLCRVLIGASGSQHPLRHSWLPRIPSPRGKKVMCLSEVCWTWGAYRYLGKDIPKYVLPPVHPHVGNEKRGLKQWESDSWRYKCDIGTFRACVVRPSIIQLLCWVLQGRWGRRPLLCCSNWRPVHAPRVSLRAAVTKPHRLGGSGNRSGAPHRPGGWESESGVSTGLVSAEVCRRRLLTVSSHRLPLCLCSNLFLWGHNQNRLGST